MSVRLYGRRKVGKKSGECVFFEKAVNEVVFNDRIVYTVYQRFSVYRIALRLMSGLHTNPFI